MPDQPPSQPWDTRIREAATNISTQVEDDLRRLVTFVNDEVVPDVRRNGSSALRTAAAEFTKLAKRLDESSKPKP